MKGNTPTGERNKGGNRSVRLKRIAEKLKLKRKYPDVGDRKLGRLADAYRPVEAD